MACPSYNGSGFQETGSAHHCPMDDSQTPYLGFGDTLSPSAHKVFEIPFNWENQSIGVPKREGGAKGKNYSCADHEFTGKEEML